MMITNMKNYTIPSSIVEKCWLFECVHVQKIRFSMFNVPSRLLVKSP